jgi:hypothetical protein
MPHPDGSDPGEIANQVLESVTDKFERKATIGMAFGVATGQLARYTGKKEVKHLYEDGSYLELEEKREETADYAERFVNSVLNSGSKKALFYSHFPPKRAINHWKQIGRADGFDQLDVDFEELYREQLSSENHYDHEHASNLDN